MKEKLILIVIVTTLILPLNAMTVGAGDINIKGELSSRLEGSLAEYDLLLISNQLKLNFNHYTPEAGLTTATLEISDGKETKVYLKEAYAELYYDSTDLTIGKQRIAWGKADGINPTDNFNPQDQTQPFADDNKIGVTAVRARHYYTDWLFDLVWVPCFTSPEFAEPGERWSLLPSGRIKPVYPEDKLENSEYGVRASRWTPAVDFSVSYFNGYSKEPAFPAEARVEGDQYIWEPEFYRVHVLGGDFSRDFGSFVVRGEGAYFKPDEEFDLKRPYYRCVLGVDFNLIDELYVNTQYYREEEEGREAVDMITLATQYEVTPFQQFELNVSYGIDGHDYLINPVYKVDVIDSLSLTLGAYLFEGDEGTLFGSFVDKDYLYFVLNKAF